jgi:hypothetical protein
MKPMSVSQRVIHEKYGLGTITEADRHYTTIEFDDFGRKKFVTRIVKLETRTGAPAKAIPSSTAGLNPSGTYLLPTLKL